jgi:CRP/FNR family transcriptional regulator
MEVTSVPIPADGKILALGAPRHFARGAVLFSEGDKAAGFYRIRKGEVRITKLDELGRELEVTRVGPGDFLGEAVAFAGGRFPFFAQAIGPTDAAYFEIEAVFRRVDRDPRTARFFIDLLARKCVVLSARIESLGLRTVRQRLVRFLLEDGSGAANRVVTLKIRKGELARQLGTVGETLSRTLRQMRDEGLIEVKGGDIRIVDPARLREELVP